MSDEPQQMAEAPRETYGLARGLLLAQFWVKDIELQPPPERAALQTGSIRRGDFIEPPGFQNSPRPGSVIKRGREFEGGPIHHANDGCRDHQ